MTELDELPETGTGDIPVELSRRLVAEALGTGLLIVAVIGSGIMASRLSPSDVGLQLLENAAATAGALIGLILIFGSISGGHFNPVVTLVDRAYGTISSRDTGLYIVAQIIGGCLGADRRQPDVRPPGRRVVDDDPVVGGAVAVRGGRHRRAAAGHPRLRPHRPRRRRRVRRRAVDRRRLLLHQLDQLRQPRRHDRPHPVGHASPGSSRRRRRCSSSCSSSAASSPSS